MISRALATAALVLSVPASLAAADPSVTVEDAWARASIGTSRPAAAYATIRNEGDVAVALAGVRAAISETASLHESMTEDGIARMRPVPTLTIPAGGSVTLEPGGYHVMLMGLTEPLVEGRTFDATFQFADGATLTAEVPVLSIAAKGPEGSSTR